LANEKKKRERIIGIDLGTSNSAAAAMMGGRPVIVPSAEGSTQYGKAFPSYVAKLPSLRLSGKWARIIK
jgi:molecular chaperone DnaK